MTTTQSQRLIESAVDTYDKSREFYDTARDDAATLEVREPEEGETVVALVSDRHDNIGMDRVARAVADAGGATAVFDAGDDTSTGERWEAFSLDSLNTAFEDLDRYGVAGNHDHGSFVTDYLADLGWTMLDGEVIDGPGEATLLGVNDPRSSGLGNWRDESGLSFGEVGTRLADAACASEERVATILVHDANLADEALERGCADLVVGGHLHVEEPPDRRGRRERRDRLHLHDRHDRRRGVRHRDREQAAPRGDDHAADVRRRAARRAPVRGAADGRAVRGRGLHRARAQPVSFAESAERPGTLRNLRPYAVGPHGL